MDALPGIEIYQMKVSLARISPMIWRRFLVPSDLSLYGLNRVIQVLMGWEDYHLHQFKIHGRVYAVQWSEQRHYHRGEPIREIRLTDLGLRTTNDRPSCQHIIGTGTSPLQSLAIHVSS